MCGDGSPILSLRSPNPALTFKFGAHENVAISAAANNSVDVWDLATKVVAHSFHHNTASDGKAGKQHEGHGGLLMANTLTETTIYSHSRNGSIHLWDLNNCSQFRTIVTKNRTSFAPAITLPDQPKLFFDNLSHASEGCRVQSKDHDENRSGSTVRTKPARQLLVSAYENGGAIGVYDVRDNGHGEPSLVVPYKSENTKSRDTSIIRAICPIDRTVSSHQFFAVYDTSDISLWDTRFNNRPCFTLNPFSVSYPAGDTRRNTDSVQSVVCEGQYCWVGCMSGSILRFGYDTCSGVYSNKQESVVAAELEKIREGSITSIDVKSAIGCMTVSSPKRVICCTWSGEIFLYDGTTLKTNLFMKHSICDADSSQSVLACVDSNSLIALWQL